MITSYKVPAGILQGQIEFFAVAPFKVKALCEGVVYDFKDLPHSAKKIVQKRRLKNENAQYSFDKLKIRSEEERDERFAYCLWGAFNETPDIMLFTSSFTDEYKICAGRHECPYPVKFCVQKLNTPSGKPLAPREIELVLLISQGFSYKEIADKMQITEGTLITYRSNVYFKLEAHKQSDVARFALVNNLL
jgi:DNA-binding CsgD family transcriptional regulator